MNIIALFEKLGLDKTTIRELTSEEIIRIEKKINVERKLDPEIDANSANDLIEALKNYKEELAFVVGKRTFYNFFSGRNLHKNLFRFPNPDVAPERINAFFSRFLQEALLLKSDQDIAAGKYYELSDILTSKTFIPDEVYFKIRHRLLGKIDFALVSLTNENADSNAISYITEDAFFHLLSKFTSVETDDKMRDFLSVVVDLHNNGNNKEYTKKIITAMSSYAAFDEELERVLQRNRANMNPVPRYVPSSSSSSSSVPWGRMVFIFLIFIKVLIGFGRCSESERSYEPNSYGNSYQNNYGSGYGTGTSADESVAQSEPIDYFFNYLTAFDRAELKQNLEPAYEMGNGANPFVHDFTKPQRMVVEGGLTFSNKTKWDVIVMSQIEINEREMPQNAYLIKSGKSIMIQKERGYLPEKYLFYFGNKLAVFGNTQHYKENRFTKQPKNSREIMNHTFRFESDVTLRSKNGISIQSHNLSVDSDTIAKQDSYHFK